MTAKTTDLARIEQHHAMVQQRLEDQEYLQLIRDSYFKGCDELEFRFAIETCRHLGLDPIAKQIYFMRIWDSDLRREVVTPVVSIDGLRLGAERSGKYAGQTAPEWCGPDGVWRDVWLGNGPPSAARVGVLRRDFDTPVYGVAKYSSFVKTKKGGAPTRFWATAPEHMLAKCAEAQALKKCLPLELGPAARVQDADLREPEVDPRFRVKTEASPELPGEATVASIIEAVETAGGLGELDQATELLKGLDVTADERESAKSAWVAASKRLAAAERDDPESTHDYGPPPMTPEETKKATEVAGFGFATAEDKTEGKGTQ